jgi:chemotaxis methyl-accepting protein methylase
LAHSSEETNLSIIAVILHKALGFYASEAKRVWNHLPNSLRNLPFGQAYARYLHGLVRRHNNRQQYHATFFLRNRAELELVQRLVDRNPHGSSLDICVLACSKGAEVYSFLWAIRSARPDLAIKMRGVDISPEILAFAEQGVYSRNSNLSATATPVRPAITDVDWNTHLHQNAPIFERMTDEELQAMCEVDGDEARIRAWLKKDVSWLSADAGNPELVRIIGLQDIVVANRFLCHMKPALAEKCLRNVSRLIKPGGYLFVSGIDLDVRTSVARDLGWMPVTDLIKEVHEGDVSVRRGWPLEYWGLEPFRDDRPDWKMRYAAVFQIGSVPQSGRSKIAVCET